MKNILLITFILMGCTVFAQEPNPPTKEIDTTSSEVSDYQEASYPGGLRAFRNYLTNNFNFHNVDINDLTAEERTKSDYVLYIRFIIDEQGVPTHFESKNTDTQHSFFKEAERVIASTRWKPAQENGEVRRQIVVLPFVVFIEDFQ